MRYEINVSKTGHHFFATHERSLTTETQAREVYAALRAAFDASYGITVTRWEEAGRDVTAQIRSEVK